MKIPPTEEGMQKLCEMLLWNGPGDLIWGPELETSLPDDGDNDVITIESALKAIASKELSKEVKEELQKTDPIDPEQVIAAAQKKKEKDDEDEDETA